MQLPLAVWLQYLKQFFTAGERRLCASASLCVSFFSLDEIQLTSASQGRVLTAYYEYFPLLSLKYIATVVRKFMLPFMPVHMRHHSRKSRLYSS